MRISALFFGLFCIGNISFASPLSLSQKTRWVILLNPSKPADSLHAPHLKPPELVILDPDHSPSLTSLQAETVRIAYLSIGEAETYRSYWAAISTASFLVEPNKDWAGNIRVDFRDKTWQRLLLDEEIPRRLKSGFQGIMLDTIDAIPYLENSDPKRFHGMTLALTTWLQEVRRRFPEMIILVNGTEGLQWAAEVSDAYVTEGLFSTWDAEKNRCRATRSDEQKWKFLQLKNALSKRDLPVFNIEYISPGQKSLALWAKKQSRQRGYRPFIATRELDEVLWSLNQW